MNSRMFSATLFLLLCFNLQVYCCDVSVNSANGQINISGLTEMDNSKLFDADYNSVWECNPWSGSPCDGTATVSGLPEGETYFLSVVSDICEEWIPVVVEGGPVESCNDGIQNQDETGIDCGGSSCAPCVSSGCNVTVTTSGSSIQINGMTADVNAKLFDVDYNAVFYCNPWNGTPCQGEVTVNDLALGKYFLSAVSDDCDEWIPVLVEGGDGGGNTSQCETALENWNPGGFQINPDGSFTTKTDIDGSSYLESNYSANGDLIGSNTNSYISADLSISADGFINGLDNNGLPLSGPINQFWIDIFTDGDNFFLPKVTQAESGNIYVIGVTVGPLIPTTLGFNDAQLDFVILKFNSVGGLVDLIYFGSQLYENIDSNISNNISIIGLLEQGNGNVDVLLKQNFTAGPGWFTTNSTTQYEIQSDFLSSTSDLLGSSNVNGNSYNLEVIQNSFSSLVEFRTTSSFSSVSGISGNSSERFFYDYSPMTPSLSYSISQNNSNGPGGSFSNETINWFLENGESISVTSPSDEFPTLPEYIIPTGGDDFNYILDGVLFIDGVDSDNDGICDQFDCEPNNSALPNTPGTPCDDNDVNTTADVIQSDGCTCVGEVVVIECNIAIENTASGFSISGLTADANTKLFDADYNVIFQCNPWSGSPCENNVTIDNPDNGDYFLSVVSANCEEWIPITHENQNQNVGQFCQEELENTFNFVCSNLNEDGSFSIIRNINGEYLEDTYSSSFELLSSSPLDYSKPTYEIQGNLIIGDDINPVAIDPNIVQTYDNENSYLRYVTKADDGLFYLVAAVDDSFNPYIVSIYLHKLDANGNEIENILLNTIEYPFFSGLSPASLIANTGLAVDASGAVYVNLRQILIVGSSYINRTHKVAADLQSVEGGGIASQCFGVYCGSQAVLTKLPCGTYRSTITSATGSPSGNGDRTESVSYFDHSVAPRKLLVNHYSYSRNIFAYYETIERITFADSDIRFSTESNGIPDFDINPEITLFVKDSNGTVLSSQIVQNHIDNAIQLGNGQIGLILGDEFFVYNCETAAGRMNTVAIASTTIDKVFPNPANQELFVSFDSNVNQQLSIQIFDSMSRLQSEQNFEVAEGISTKLMDVSALKAGIYHLMILDENNNVETKRFVKILD